jgi:formylglycine-generating enzyme required for sulfatase activity
MGAAVRIHEPLGERVGALPLAFGGEGASVAVPGAGGELLILEGNATQWLAVPAMGASLTLNGLPLRERTALDEADVIGFGSTQVEVHPSRGAIHVHHPAGNATVAPLLHDALPGSEVVAGVREIFAPGAATAAAATPRAARIRRRRWPAVLAIAMLLAGGALLLALVPVPLQLQPAGTVVDATGIFHWHAGERLFVLPGRRALTFAHPGYRSRSVTLQVTHALAGAQPLAVTLLKLPDHYDVDTGGVAAELLVDGQPVATLPGRVDIEAGTHELIVRAPGFVDYVVRQDVEGGGQQRSLKVQLQPATGWLVLDTQPAGARVLVDGRDRGHAPLRIELDAGLRKLSLQAAGRKGWSSDIAIIGGKTLDLGRVDLAVPAPAIVATSEPGPVASTDPPDSAAADAPAATPVHTPPAARISSSVVGTLLLLPAGKYQQGSDRREQGRRNNEVQREVTLSRAFYLAETEVTNAQFRAFRPEHVSGIAMDKSLDLDLQAVSNVSWNDAVEFCNWLSLRDGLPAAYERRDGRWQLIVPNNRGYRLPTEAEWEYAARYVDGQRWQRFAWGDLLPPPAGAENLGGTESLPAKPGPEVRLASTLPDYRDQHAVVAPVGSYGRSAAGFRDLGGNVSEWMHDVYVSLPDARPVTDPMGATSDGPHAIRGANWRTSTIAELRPAWRERSAAASQVLGFRVARFAEDAR